MENFNSLDPQTKEYVISSIVKAIAYQENGGKLDLNKISAGKTGEMKSIFQFLPETWKGYAKETLGDENAPLTNENEMEVVYKKVEKWLENEKTVKQIASMWNAGTGEPDAYDGTFKMTTKTHKAGDPSKGILKKSGIPYDVPKYAENVNNYSQQFFKEKMNNQMPPRPNPQSVTQVPKEVQKTSNPTEMITNFLSSMVGAKKASAQETGPQQTAQNMPLMQPNAPKPEEVKTPNTQNMGLLGK